MLVDCCRYLCGVFTSRNIGVDVKAHDTVNFAVGNFKITAAGKEELRKLAQTATGITSIHLIEVTGYGDSTGSASVNTKLSGDRPKAAITLVMSRLMCPYVHTAAPGAMGAASNETSAGRARESSS